MYQVPPPELASHRRRPRRRSMWMAVVLVGGFGERGEEERDERERGK
jgi:hypothetical protein